MSDSLVTVCATGCKVKTSLLLLCDNRISTESYIADRGVDDTRRGDLRGDGDQATDGIGLAPEHRLPDLGVVAPVSYQLPD